MNLKNFGAAVALSSMTAAIALAGSPFQPPGPNSPAIVTASVVGSNLNITGVNFPASGPVSATLGGSSLTIASFSTTSILASVSASLSPGSYPLWVQFSQSTWVSLDVSVGALGPQGPAGPTGAMGAAGLQGPQGSPGVEGPAGQSVVGASLNVSDPNCPFGGSEFITASGVTYACNGAPGANGAAGPQGAPGATGPFGPQGVPGPASPGLTKAAEYTLTSWRGAVAPMDNQVAVSVGCAQPEDVMLGCSCVTTTLAAYLTGTAGVVAVPVVRSGAADSCVCTAAAKLPLTAAADCVAVSGAGTSSDVSCGGNPPANYGAHCGAAGAIRCNGMCSETTTTGSDGTPTTTGYNLTNNNV
jgi:hypothetical protein